MGLEVDTNGHHRPGNKTLVPKLGTLQTALHAGRCTRCRSLASDCPDNLNMMPSLVSFKGEMHRADLYVQIGHGLHTSKICTVSAL